jgi:hypothetical protein
MKYLITLMALGAVLGYALVAHADTIHGQPLAKKVDGLSGQLLHRATLTPDNTTAEDNTTAAGGTAVTYSFTGGEIVCIQADTTAAYIEFIAAGSMTAAGAKGFKIPADNNVQAECYLLMPGTLKVSALCTVAGPCIVKLFERRFP